MSGDGEGQWPFPAPRDDGAADHLRQGDPLPDLDLPATIGETVNPARLHRAVVFVYTWTGRPGLDNPPGWDDIPGAHGSTPEAEGFRDRHQDFADLAYSIVGLSVQSPEWQSELAARLALPYALASDSDGRLQRALRLPTFLTGGATYLKRLTLVVTGGRIHHVFYPVHPPDTHAASVCAWLAGHNTTQPVSSRAIGSPER